MNDLNKEIGKNRNTSNSETLAKRKEINGKIIRFGCFPIMGLFFIVFIFNTLSEEESKNYDTKELQIPKTQTQLSNQNINIDYNSFNYSFPNSNYYYNVKINNIKTTIQKNEFETKEDEYSIGKKVDGYILSISFQITNPYDKEIMAPIPNYYAITSLDKEYFSGSTTYSRSCECKIDNSTKIEDTNGKELGEISKEKCGYSDYCIHFKAKESKTFTVTFTDPIIITTKKIVFIAFDKKWIKEGSTRERNTGFIIDTEAKKIIGIENL